MQENQMAEGIRLKVAEAGQEDVGRGIVRVSDAAFAVLELERGEIVSIVGERETAALVAAARSADQGLDVIRVDGVIRTNAHASIGDYVQVRKATWREAQKVTLAPARKGLRAVAPGDVLRQALLYRPVVRGDLISVGTASRSKETIPSGMYPEELFRGLLGSLAIGLGEVRLVVAATVPSGTVRIGPQTEVELLPEYVETKEARIPDVTYDDIGGLGEVINEIREVVELPLKHPELFDRLGIAPPKGVLLHGPPGTGKTLLAQALANEAKAHFATINGPEIMGRFYGESEERLRAIFQEGQENPPAIIFIDELDSIAPKRETVMGEVERRIVAQLLTLMDGLTPRGNVIVIGATNRVGAIDLALRRPGRFDREIELRVPDRNGRRQILTIHTRAMPLAADVNLDWVADLTHGCVGSDLAALCREAALNALRRVLPDLDLRLETVPAEVLERLIVTHEDFSQALRRIRPSALRELLIEVPRVTWSDVGGLDDVKRSLRETVELPLTHPQAFERLGIKPPKGVLLYGPPGTGKTLLAKAVANEARANFMLAKGSDLLSKWYGESEQRIREFFAKARQVAPAIVFFDEVDALVPRRGTAAGEPHVTERIVNQLLSELDGLEELRGVVILGATNRPDLIDPALLRPGRFDALVYVPVPDAAARHEILAVHTRHMALADDVDLQELVRKTDRFTGADLALICMRAAQLALRKDLEAKAVTHADFLAALAETLPSVTEAMEREYAEVGKRLRQGIPQQRDQASGHYL
ncbi:MAG: AAA family ATPase [Candidatus Methylomirabilota bacterium]|nr:MAG: AAA family ATPase [candidate division NC10 bacterium]